MSNKSFLLGVVFWMSCAGAVADNSCQNPVTSAKIAECEERNAEVSEKELNLAYRTALKGLAEQEAGYAKEYPDRPPLNLRAILIAAEKNWLKFRERSCKLEYQMVLAGNPSRGDYPGIAEIVCTSKLAHARAEQLDQLNQN